MVVEHRANFEGRICERRAEDAVVMCDYKEVKGIPQVRCN